MRIAVDLRTLCDGKERFETSGIQVAVIELLNQLQRLDTVNDYLLFETHESTYATFNGRWKKILLPSFGLPSIIWTQTVFPWYLARYGADVLWAPKYICPLCFCSRTKLFTTIYDLSYLHFPETLSARDRIQLRVLIPLSARRSTAVFTDSAFIKRDFEKNYRSIKTPVIAVPLGRPDWSVPPGYSCGRRQEFLFFAGNLEPRKNLIHAVKALEILHKEGLSIELHITSPSSWKSRSLMEYMESSPVKKNIKLLGFLPREELKKKYLSCKALLYPSLYEGFGLPVLEALAMDCPVITSRDTVMQEIAGDSAVYFDPRDPGDIAEKLRMVYSKGFEREKYLGNKERVLERYSWETAARKMLSVMVSPAERRPFRGNSG